MSDASPFLGRSIQIVNDLSVDEQVYLYEQTRRLKEAIREGGSAEEFRIRDPDMAVYLFFMEDSTRTKESFRNASKFHDLRLNDFSSEHSSVKKKETITDTVRMLSGYSARSLFIVRTRLEGTCRWLMRSLGDYAEREGLIPPAFINAGDGRHEHPTQEFLDEFSFLEQKDWDRSHIHLALVGDLFHGRTVHSKVDGLKVFREVEIDLVAPPELEMPPHYVQRMKANNFHIRVFSSIEEYLATKRVAPLWYFTRLQLERMGDRLLDKADVLRESVTFRREFEPRLPEGARFFHPLPRHGVHPTIPHFLDDTRLNGWDAQSRNGYFTRIVEIALLGGRLGSDFKGEPLLRAEYSDDFVEEAEVGGSKKPEYKIGIKPVDRGIVIDHIGKGHDPLSIWRHIDKIRETLGLNSVSSHGVYPSAGDGRYKGIVSLPNQPPLDERAMKMLGAIAPGCTLNVVEDGHVRRKYRLHMPPRVYNLPAISCKNEDCISHPDHNEYVTPEFIRSRESRFICMYCEREHDFQEIW